MEGVTNRQFNQTYQQQAFDSTASKRHNHQAQSCIANIVPTSSSSTKKQSLSSSGTSPVVVVPLPVPAPVLLNAWNTAAVSCGSAAAEQKFLEASGYQNSFLPGFVDDQIDNDPPSTSTSTSTESISTSILLQNSTVTKSASASFLTATVADKQALQSQRSRKVSDPTAWRSSPDSEFLYASQPRLVPLPEEDFQQLPSVHEPLRQHNSWNNNSNENQSNQFLTSDVVSNSFSSLRPSSSVRTFTIAQSNGPSSSAVVDYRKFLRPQPTSRSRSTSLYVNIPGPTTSFGCGQQIIGDNSSSGNQRIRPGTVYVEQISSSIRNNCFSNSSAAATRPVSCVVETLGLAFENSETALQLLPPHVLAAQKRSSQLHNNQNLSNPITPPPAYDSSHRRQPPPLGPPKPVRQQVAVSRQDPISNFNNNGQLEPAINSSGAAVNLISSENNFPENLFYQNNQLQRSENPPAILPPRFPVSPQKRSVVGNEIMQIATAEAPVPTSNTYQLAQQYASHQELARHDSSNNYNYENMTAMTTSSNSSSPKQQQSRSCCDHQTPSTSSGAPPPFLSRQPSVPTSQSTPGNLAMQRSTSNLDLQGGATTPTQGRQGIDLRRPSQPSIKHVLAPLASLREYGSTSSIDLLGRSSELTPSLKERSSLSSQPIAETSRQRFFNRSIKSTVDKDSGKKSAQTALKSAAPVQIDSRGPNISSLEKCSNNKLSRSDAKNLSVKEKSKPNRTKSLANDSIFRKLIGGGNSNKGSTDVDTPGGANTPTTQRDRENAPDPETCEDQLRRRIFAHYDCHSLSANPFSLKDQRSMSACSHGGNTTTGASAASRSNRFVSPQGSEEVGLSPGGSGGATPTGEQSRPVDPGDGKSNELLLSCPYFRNEIGCERNRTVALCKETESQWIDTEPPRTPGRDTLETWIRQPSAAEVSVLENLSGIYLGGMMCAKRIDAPQIEHSDAGCFYYRHCFVGKAHSSYFGVDEQFGPVAVSVIRDRVDPVEYQRSGLGSSVLYRLIVRLSDLTVLRGSVLEESLPSFQAALNESGAAAAVDNSEAASPTKLPVRELLELLVPELQVSCLRLALPVPRTEDLLLKLDEQGVMLRYKVGIMYCKAGQSSEEQMYNNEASGPYFDDFLDIIGQRVRLKGFDKYKGGLDTKGDSTGQYSVYTTFEQYEIMFHVSTLLPFTANNRQQLSRKRHIGNDIVTVIFQEPGALPFTPQTVRSHFQHVFIVVRVNEIGPDNITYSVAVSRSKDVPSFGPQIPGHATFTKSKAFRDFLLTKIINAENAVHKSEKFAKMAARTSREYIRDLAEKHCTSHTVPETSISKLSSIILGKKKERCKPKLFLNACIKGAIVWKVQVEDFSLCAPVEAQLGISVDNVVVVERSTNDVIFNTRTHSVMGWTSHGHSLKLYYDHGDVVVIKSVDEEGREVKEIIERLRTVTRGCETIDMTLRRNAVGQLGFHIQHEGIVSDVEMYGCAWQAGLRQGSRLVEICKVSTNTMSHEKMLEVLRSAPTVRVLVLPPLEDGSPRRGCADPYCSAILVPTSPGTTQDIPLELAASQHQPHPARTALQLQQQRSLGFVASPGNSCGQVSTAGASGVRQTAAYERSSFRRQVMQRQQISTAASANPRCPTAGAVVPAVNGSATVGFAQQPEQQRSTGHHMDNGYESGNNLSSRSLDELEHSPNGKAATDFRSGSADQGFLSSEGTQEYPTNTMSSASSGEDRWYTMAPPSSDQNRWVSEGVGGSELMGSSTLGGHLSLTDTLSSTGSTASSEMSSDSVVGGGCGKQTAMVSPRKKAPRPNDLVPGKCPVPTLPPKVYNKAHNNQEAYRQENNLRRFAMMESQTTSDPTRSSRQYCNVVPQSHVPLSANCRARSEDSLTIALSSLQEAMTPDASYNKNSAMVASYANGVRGYYEDLFSSSSTPEYPEPDRSGSNRRPYSVHQGVTPVVETPPPPPKQRGLNWNNLVDVASRAIEGITQRHVSMPSVYHNSHQQNSGNSNSAVELNSCYIKLEAAQERIEMLLEKIERLSDDLQKEREARNAGEIETMNLRVANKRLEEERKSAEVELKRFTEWFFKAVDSNFAAVGGPPPITDNRRGSNTFVAPNQKRNT